MKTPQVPALDGMTPLGLNPNRMTTKNITAAAAYDAARAAAAPDMALQIEALKASNAALLAALVSLEEQFRPVTDTDQYIAGIARAAIAKATPPTTH